MKRSFFKGAIATALLSWALPVSLFAEQKNLAIDDVDFTPIQVMKHNQVKDSVRVKIVWQRDQFKSLDNRDLSIETPFYSGTVKGQAKRIMKDRDYFLKTRTTSYDFNPDEACPAAGKYWAKIWLSVRNNDVQYSPNKNYKTYEEYFPYTCLDRKKIQKVNASSEFKLADAIDRYTYKQLNLLVDVDNKQFNAVKNEGDNFEVRLYTERDGNNYRVGKGKTYLVPNANRASFSFKIKELCGEMDGLLDLIFGKEVEVGCRITVVDGDGSRNPNYDEYQCPTERFICYK